MPFIKTLPVDTAQVSVYQNQIILTISRTEFEQRLGQLLQRIYAAADRHMPERTEDLSLIIRDEDGNYENNFKIWRSA